MSYIRRKRIKYAFKFGKLEHKFGRLMGWISLLNLGYNIFIKDKVGVALSLLLFIIWLSYISSHTFEKKLFGHFGPRSGWGKK